MKSNPVRWFEIYVRDIERAKNFYQEVLQISLGKIETSHAESLEMWGFPMDRALGGCTGALVKMKGFAPQGNSIIIYFASENCAIEESRVEKAGGKIEKSKFSIGQYGFITLCYDTEGNMFGVHSME